MGTGGSATDNGTTGSTVGTGGSASGAARDSQSNKDCPPGLANKHKEHGKAGNAC